MNGNWTFYQACRLSQGTMCPFYFVIFPLISKEITSHCPKEKHVYLDGLTFNHHISKRGNPVTSTIWKLVNRHFPEVGP